MTQVAKKADVKPEDLPKAPAEQEKSNIKKEKKAFNSILTQIVNRKGKKKIDKKESRSKIENDKKESRQKSDSKPKEKSVKSWSTEQVIEWMNSLNLTKDYSAIITSNGVDGDVLKDMTKEDWNEMGIVALGDVKKLLKHASEL